MKFPPAASAITLAVLLFAGIRVLNHTPPTATSNDSATAALQPAHSPKTDHAPGTFADARLSTEPAVPRVVEAAAANPPAAVPLPNPSPADVAFQAFDDWLRRHTDAVSGAGVAEAWRDEALLAEGIRLARHRRDQLEDLIQSDPRQAIERAVPDAVRATLPAGIRDLLEERVSGRGDFEVLAALAEPGREAEVQPLRRQVVLGDRRFTAFVYGRRADQSTLRDVSLHGIALGPFMAVDESPVRELAPAETEALLAVQPEALCADGSDHPVTAPLARALEAYGKPVLLCCPGHSARFEARLAAAGTGTEQDPTGEFPLAASPATEGLKRLLFIRVDFSDLEGESFTTSRAADLTRELHRFYQDNSYGRAGFLEIGSGSDVTPVLRMPRTASSYGSNDDAGDLRNDARAAARNAGYVLSNYDYDLTCMRSVPGFSWAGLGFVGAPGSWIRGTSSTGVTAHELGHNFGLNHANFWDTDGPTVTGPGKDIEYGDKFDTMGAASAGNNHFNARYKRLLDWLQDGEYSIATTNGTYRIHAHDQTNAVVGSRGLQIFANSRTNYWVEFRQRFPGNRWLSDGVSLRWTGRGSQASLLLDTTPESAREKDDAAVTLGRTYSDLSAGIHITPVAKGGSAPAWIDVVVQRGDFEGNRPPTLQLVAPNLQGTTASTLEFQAVASDPDGDPLAFFWEFGDETLGTNTASLTHRWTANGEYLVECTASDTKGGVARAHAVVRIGSPTSQRISGRITTDGEPVVGARIGANNGRFTFTDSQGNYTLPGLTPATYVFSATLDGAPFEPVSFTNPVNLTSSRAGLDFAAVDVAQVRPVTLLAAGSSWRYLDQGTAPAATWTRSTFDDSQWDVGPAILGYGGDRETTVLSFGSNSSQKHITTWFRRTFVVENPALLTQIRIGLLRDDGAAVYLNGTELFRDNLPSGTLTPQTLASSAVGGGDEVIYFEHSVDPARLVAGTNLFAVEIHQTSRTSSDIAFDLRLTADLVQTIEPGIRLVRPAADESIRTPGRLVLSAAVGELPGSPLRRVDFLADGRVIGSAAQPPYAITWINPPAGQHLLAAAAILADGTSVLSPETSAFVVDANLTPTLVRRGSLWRYLDTGIAPDASWNDRGFDDSTWGSGPARLGYGEDGEATVVGFGSNPSIRHITTWFRHGFDLADAATVTNLIVRLARDDGAVVHLNGRELFRSGIRTGVVTPTLVAQADVRDDAEVVFTEFTVPATGLVDGGNVLAVEVHQASRASTDMGFDLELVGQRSALPTIPRLSLRRDGGQIVLAWPASLSGWRLEQTQQLGPDAQWETVPLSSSAQNPEVTLTLQPSEEPTFYRLARAPE